MNWLRIFSATALAASLLCVGGVIWFSNPATPNRPRLLRGNASATIILQLVPAEPNALVCWPDAHTFVMILRSQKVAERTMASLDADELARVHGSAFLQTGKTPFFGVSVEAIRGNENRLSIVAEHRDPAAARLVVERLVTTFIEWNREITRNEAERAVNELEARRLRLVDDVQHYETTLAAMQRVKPSSGYENEERDLKIHRALLRNFDERIADTAAWKKKPLQLPFRIVAAQVESGPFWKRTMTDFTTEAQRLLEP